MAEITSVPAASVAGMIFSLILSIGLPIGLLIYLRNRTGARISAFLIGGATFFLSAMVLEQLLHAAVLAAAGNALTGNIWLYALYGGLAAGLFEETGRYVAMKFCMKKQLTRQSALMYGAGHGGIEAVLILGLASINNLSAVALVNSGGFESFLSSLSAEESDALIQAFSALWSTPSWQFFLGGIERILAVALHISLSVLVYRAVRDRRISFYLLAVGLHVLVDSAALAASRFLSPILVEALVLLLTGLTGALAVRLYREAPAD